MGMGRWPVHHSGHPLPCLLRLLWFSGLCVPSSGYDGPMSTRERGLFALLAVCAPMAACAPIAPPPQRPAPPRSGPVVPQPPPPIPDYIPSLRAAGQWNTVLPRRPGDDGGMLVGGARVAPSGAIAPDAGIDALVGGHRIPTAWGGGFLFWSLGMLYHAETFLSPLQPLTPLPSQVKSVSQGPGFLLIRTTEGQRIALRSDRTVGPPTPIGLLDVAALPSGPAAALLEDGTLMISLDQGASWKVVSDLRAAAAALSVVDDQIWLKLEDSGARRLESNGVWTAFQQVPPASPQADPGPCGEEFPPAKLLTAALQQGLPLLQDDVVLAPVDGALVRVNLRNGQCLSEPRRIAPSGASCEFVVTAKDALAVCTMSSRGALVFNGILDDDGGIKREAAFEGSIRFHEAGGHLLADGPCSGSQKTPGVVCVRGDDGKWVELDRRDDRWDGWLPRWIPKDDGGALGVTTEPEPAWIDARTGKRTILNKVEAGALRNLLSNRDEGPVDRLWHVAADGAIHGWSYRKHVTVDPQEGVVTSPFTLATMETWGPRAFGFDQRGHAWQTIDDGENWTEVLAPPSFHRRSPPTPRRCSLAGCDLQGWFRVGWRTTPPEPRATLPSAEPRPLSVHERPTLSCSRTGAVRFLSFPLPEGTTRETPMLGMGARILPESRGDVRFVSAEFVLGTGPYHRSGSDLGLRAFTHQRDISDEQGPRISLGLARSVWFSAPFDASASIRTARFTLRDIAASAPGGLEHDDWLEASRDGTALPVMGAKPGTTAGWVLQFSGTSPLLWVGADGRTQGHSYALGLEDAEYEPISIALRGNDELLTLVKDDGCSARVLALGQRSSQRLFALPKRPTNVGCPPNRDVLAIGPNGKIGVIRTPSGAAPATEKDPALLLLPGQPLVPLAPWSTLLPASAAACKQDATGYRTILMTDGSWLSVVDGGVAVPGESGMMAMVRWSTERVCLEAVEVDGGVWEPARQQLTTTVVARFDDTPVAARTAVARGMDLRIPLTCTLTPP
jgi:hypothetical protein